MLDVKKLIAQLLDSLTVKTGTVTTKVGTSSVSLKKCGKLVVFTGWWRGASASTAARTTLMTIPEGFRPSAAALTLANNNATEVIVLEVSTGGIVNNVGAITRQTYHQFNMCWLTD